MMTLDKLKEKALINNIPIVKDETLNYILEFIKKNKIKNILEIGSAVGYSAAYFASVSEDIKILTIEKDELRFREAKENIEKLNLEKQIKIYNEDANHLLDNIEFKEYMKIQNIESFDMVFIDAAKGQYINFLNKSLKHMRKGSYIVADNVLFKGYVLGVYEGKKHRTIVRNLREFIEILKDEEKYKTEIHDLDDGFMISEIKCNINEILQT